MSTGHASLVSLALVLPLLLAALLAWLGRGGGLEHSRARLLLPLASLPALAVAGLPDGGIELPWLLLGSRLSLEDSGRAMLWLTGVAWTLAGWFAVDRVGERLLDFSIWWLLSLFGVVLAALAGDAATFYCGYGFITLSAYGLIVHARSDAARRAGRVYLSMAILAEAAILAGLLLVVSAYGNLPLAQLVAASADDGPGWGGWLLVLGFSVKVGVAGVHMWLPIAHPAAPVPASAVLSGVLVKAGLLGLVRVVPVEAIPAPALPWLVGLGLFTTFYAVVVGVAQSRMKTVLAYSTVSQMGLLFVSAVLALVGPDRGAALAVVSLLVLHHGLNKAALFLAAGGGPLRGPWRSTLFALPALSLVGLPLLSGALAKGGLKQALGLVELPGWAMPALALSSAGTALLMWRCLMLGRALPGPPKPLHRAWLLLVAAGVAVPWLWAGHVELAVLPGAAALWSALWPLAVAALGVWMWRAWRAQGRAGLVDRVPEGDILVPLQAAAVVAWQRLRPVLPRGLPRGVRAPGIGLERLIAAGELRLGTLAAAGTAMLLVLAVLWLSWR